MFDRNIKRSMQYYRARVEKVFSMLAEELSRYAWVIDISMVIDIFMYDSENLEMAIQNPIIAIEYLLLLLCIAMEYLNWININFK